ncbi:MAG: DUF1499 domain-containing protein [Simkaniaceae bacterium]|nr:DUF1499 domain-containing protein [Simkaniaceae bacterium]
MKYFLVLMCITLGLVEGKLQPCPDSPNCVCSCETSTRNGIQPLPLVGKHPLELIEQFFAANYKTEVIEKTPTYLHLVVSTPLLGFKDDLEFQLDTKIVQVRSASRVGYYDFGTNRKRIENLRKFLALQRQKVSL